MTPSFHRIKNLFPISLIYVTCLIALSVRSGTASADGVSAADYPTLHDAIEANPGGTIVVPNGDHPISESLRIRHSGTVLCGFGRIVQTNSDAAIVVVEGAQNVVVRDVTLARPDDAVDTHAAGLLAQDSDFVRIENVRILDNHSNSAAIRLRSSSYGRIENCQIINYKRIAIDDRTQSPLLGYAFRCIDGTGIGVSDCLGTMILGNQIIERRLLPSREIAEKHHLGELVEGKQPTKFGELGRWVEEGGFAKHWHQGSAIAVTSPERTTITLISGNYIENSAQGIDIHSDNFICTENIVNHGMMGMKAMHGSRNGIIARNIFSHVDNWGIMLGPGTASHPAEAAADGKPAREANADGTIVISANVISDFGRGHEFWNWGGDGPDAAASAVIRFDRGQLPTNPPLSNVLVEGNVITTASEELGDNGEVVQPKPRYNYAVLIESPPPGSTDLHYPTNIRIVDNLFLPGRQGLSNVSLPESN
jgi:hypothetical protein